MSPAGPDRDSRRRRFAVVDAPSNLGLSPPSPSSPPGVYKLPWALRNAGIVERLDAFDAGTVIPPRYSAEWSEGQGTRNAAAIAAYSKVLAARLKVLLGDGHFPVVLGGDCSILLGAALAMKDLHGRFGVAFLDGHTDFRHLGNAPALRAAAGEDLAICTGRGDERLTSLASGESLVDLSDVVLIGVRDVDEQLTEVLDLGASAITAGQVAQLGATEAGLKALKQLERADGPSAFWIHVDLDVVDGAELPAVDSPEPDGPSFATVMEMIGILAGSPHCIGMHITIYDPDLDPELRTAPAVADGLAKALLRASAA